MRGQPDRNTSMVNIVVSNGQRYEYDFLLQYYGAEVSSTELADGFVVT